MREFCETGLSCSNSKIASHILPARRQPGPRGVPPAALAADPLLPTLSGPLTAEPCTSKAKMRY